METRFTTIALLASAALAACGGKASPGTLPVNAPAMGSASSGMAGAGSAGSAATPASAGSATPADPCAGG